LTLRKFRAPGSCRRPSRDRSQWTAAVSSLTVARQRGNCTRFPVFATGQRRANRRTFQRTENSGVRNLPGGQVEVKSGRPASVSCSLFSPTGGLSDKDQAAVGIADVKFGHAVVPVEWVAAGVAVLERLHMLPQ